MFTVVQKYCLFFLAWGFFISSPVYAAASKPAFSATDKADIAKIEAYLNHAATIKARFTQLNPNGSQDAGTAYISRPGRLRFEYDPPSPFLVVADGSYLVFTDKSLKETSWLSLDDPQTGVAGMMVRKSLSLDGSEITVRKIARAGNRVILSLFQTGHRDMGYVDMVFEMKPNVSLQEWTVFDPNGNQTIVKLSNIQTGISLSTDLFRQESDDILDQRRR